MSPDDIGSRCFVCALGSFRLAERKTENGKSFLYRDCLICGSFRAVESIAIEIDRLSPEQERLRRFLAAHIRQSNLAGERVVELGPDWRLRAEGHARTPVAKKLDLMLRLYALKSDYAGQDVELFDRYSPPLVDATTHDEFIFLREALVRQGLLEQVSDRSYRVTATGWERVSPPAVGGIPGTCFVAMSFAPELNPIFDQGIRPAVEDDCGFRVIRLDRVEHNENINDIIIADLRSAEIVVADFTNQRAGVYFEAGFALGLGRPVIWTCRTDDVDGTHFDTRSYNYIRWDSATDLRIRLAARIRATIPSTPKRT